MTYTDPAAIASAQDAIRGEQNAVYACGLAAAELNGAAKRRALAQLAAHRQRLQACSLLIEPSEIPPTPPAFTPAEPIDSARSARAALASVDNALVGAYAQLAASTQDADRAFAIGAAQECARSAVQWGAPSQAFPTAG